MNILISINIADSYDYQVVQINCKRPETQITFIFLERYKPLSKYHSVVSFSDSRDTLEAGQL